MPIYIVKYSDVDAPAVLTLPESPTICQIYK